MEVKIPSFLIAENITEVLDNYPIFNQIATYPKILIDFSKMSYIRPTGLAFIASYMLYSKFAHTANEYYYKISKHTDVQKYFEQMGFNELFNLKKRQDDQTKSIGMQVKNYCELRRVASIDDCQIITEQLTNIIKSQVKIPFSMLLTISHSLGEVINNIFHHSQSPINGFVCAQTFPEQQQVEIAIVDCGMGIKKSLKGNPTFDWITDDSHAIHSATGKKITSKPDTNAGEGLFFAKRFIEENKGDLIIMSGTGQMHIKNGKMELYNTPYWQGTLFSCTFKLSNIIDIKDIFDSEFPDVAEELGLDF